MPDPNFVKGICRHCGGHIEFPAYGLGRTIPCPHCGQATELTAMATGGSAHSVTPSPMPSSGARNPAAVPAPAPSAPRRAEIIAVIVLALLLAVLAGAFFWRGGPAHNRISAPANPPITHSTASAPSSPPMPSLPSNAPASSAISQVPSEPQPESDTNDFAIMPYRLEQAPGSSLVFVTGVISNLSSNQRFGVRLEFSLLDANTNPVGKATDYQGLMEPHSDWHFKALVMASKAASVRFNSIDEMK